MRREMRGGWYEEGGGWCEEKGVKREMRGRVV